ncbi:DUF1049 domain-containing protein, partial [Klebsiella aerogenes]
QQIAPVAAAPADAGVPAVKE